MKQTLILLHGALGSQAQLNDLKKELVTNFNVHTLNFEGHGGIASDAPFSIQLFTQNVLDYLDEKDIEQASFFGYSMGGYVALNLALKATERVDKIYTLGTKFKWDEDSATKEVKMLNPEKVAEKVPRFAERLDQLHHPLDWKEVMRKTAEMMLAMGRGARLNDADFEKIPHKVVIGLGSLDQMVSHTESEKVASLLPNARLVLLDGVEHPIEKIAISVLVDYIRSS